MARIQPLVIVFSFLILSLPSPAKADGYDWTGMYVGVNAGAAVAKSNTDVTVPWVSGGFFAISSARAINSIGERRIHDVGVTGGGQIGFDYQWGPAVVGMETDFQALDLSDADRVSGSYTCCPGNYHIENHLDTDWLYTLRGKLGLAVGRVLVFGSGGLAVADLEETFSFMDDFNGAREQGKIRTHKPGWTAGGGLEVAILDHVSVRAEYLHVDIGHKSQRENSFTTTGGPFPLTDMKHSIDLQSEIGRIAVNYRF